MHFSHFNIPQFGSTIHRTSTDQDSMGVEWYRNNLTCMPGICSKLFSGNSAPQLCSMIKWTCTNLISKWDIERHAINSVFMAFKRVYQITCGCVPEFTSSIVASCQKLISILIKTTISQWKNVSFEFFN